MTCPHADPIDDRKARCTLANARVSIPRVCGPCQAAWIDGQPPTADRLTPVLVSITGKVNTKFILSSVSSDNPRPLLASQPIEPRNPLACVHVGRVVASQSDADRKCGFRRQYECEHAPGGTTDARRCGLCPEWET